MEKDKIIKVYGYTKCSTVKKALKHLQEKEITYIHIDNVSDKLTSEQIKGLHLKSELPIKRFFNTSGILYREMGLKDIVDGLSLEQAYELLASDGMLVKRPIFDDGEHVLVGFKIKEWENVIK